MAYNFTLPKSGNHIPKTCLALCCVSAALLGGQMVPSAHTSAALSPMLGTLRRFLYMPGALAIPEASLRKTHAICGTSQIFEAVSSVTVTLLLIQQSSSHRLIPELMSLASTLRKTLFTVLHKSILYQLASSDNITSAAAHDCKTVDLCLAHMISNHLLIIMQMCDIQLPDGHLPTVLSDGF